MALLRTLASGARPGLKSRATDSRPFQGLWAGMGCRKSRMGRPSIARDFNPGRGLLLAVLLLLPYSAAAQTAPEYDVKAAFLYNFTKFVDWPAAAFPDATSLKVCLLGEDPFGRSLQAVAGEPVENRKLVIVRADAPPKPGGCQVLFISRSEREKLPQILAALKDSPVLTVGDTKGFVDQGVIINFILEGSKVRFEINTDAADKAGLKVSSKLLQLARRIVPAAGAKAEP
ncbi:MAG TPA: YfiR family protein [Thermoanaerobaculia bacterium]|nr:YfiR family protein [Thermoanaerobaculia bacterium]